MRKKNNVLRNLLIGGGIIAAVSGGCECPTGEPTPEMEEIREDMRQSDAEVKKFAENMKGYKEKQDKAAEKAAGERKALGERIDGVKEEVAAARAEQAEANEDLSKKVDEGFEKIDGAITNVQSDVNILRDDMNKANKRLDEAADHRKELEERIKERTNIYDFKDGYRLVIRPVAADKDVISLFHNNRLVKRLRKRDSHAEGEVELELLCDLFQDAAPPAAGKTPPKTPPERRAGLYKGTKASEKSQELEGYLEALRADKGKDLQMGIVDAIFTGAPDLDGTGWDLFSVFREAGKNGKCLTAFKSKEVSLPEDYNHGGRPNLRIKKGIGNYAIFSGDNYRWTVKLVEGEKKLDVHEEENKEVEKVVGGKTVKKKEYQTVKKYSISMDPRYMAWMTEAWDAAFARGHDEVFKTEEDASKNTRRRSLTKEFGRGLKLRAAGNMKRGEDIGYSRSEGEILFSAGLKDENYTFHGLVEESGADHPNGDHRDKTTMLGKARVDLKLGGTPTSDKEDKRPVLGIEAFTQARDTDFTLAEGSPVVSTDDLGLYTTTEKDLGGTENVHDTHTSYSITVKAGESDFRLSFFNGSQRDNLETSSEVDIVDNSSPTDPFIHHDIHVDSKTTGAYEGAELQWNFPVKSLEFGIFASKVYDGFADTDVVTEDRVEGGSTDTTVDHIHSEYSQDGLGFNFRSSFKDGRWRLSGGAYRTWAEMEEDGVPGSEMEQTWFAYSTCAIGNSVSLSLGGSNTQNDSDDGSGLSGFSLVLGVDGSRQASENVEAIDAFLNNEALREWSSQYTSEAVDAMRRWERYSLMSEMNSRLLLSLDFNEVYTPDQKKELAAEGIVGTVIGGSGSAPALLAVTFSEDPAYTSSGVDFVKKWKKGMVGAEYRHLDGKGGYDDDDMVGVVGGVTF